ncbi:MAG: 6,7-dimethyl-8-ribityllumazine synthase [Flavobacteriia bacterium]|nr:6,7-dimethyl-8-ribityllumazine synthase [Flavobacteriia bacterium]OJX37076.1 MAG: 6,7-dimethyl-8-ribityllumazine synthase [Flavobacteriia bacterium 40-80]
MATAFKNLSDYDKNNVPNGADFKIGIVVSEWNDSITNALLFGAKTALLENGVKEENIMIRYVPGTFELPLGCQLLLDNTDIDGAIAIGVVIQGETRHFDFVCEGATQGLMQVGLEYNTPVMYCVLTDDNIQQSLDRSGGKHGNKGTDTAIACLKMIEFKRSMQ